MPWRIEKRKGSRPWKIVRTSSGKVVGSSKTHADALGSLKARYAAESRKA